MEVYRNKLHSSHLYLKIEEDEVPSLQSAVFEELIKEHHSPLQVMVSSDAGQLIEILERCGFVLKRKCYEMDVCHTDLAKPLSTDGTMLAKARRGTPDFTECAGMMYAYYSATHASDNPLTAAPEDFFEQLPDTVLYRKTGGRIDSAAFVDGNEIAYVLSYAEDGFSRFADALLAHLFGKFDRIVFEADDSDWAATRLKEKFSVSPGPSYNTYIKPVTEEDDMKHLFESDNISFVAVSEHLVNDYLTMVNDYENVNRFIGGKNKAYTREQELQWVRKKLEENAAVYSMLEKKSRRFIGNIEFMDLMDNQGELGIAITAEMQDQGYGTEAIRAMTRYGFDQLGLKKIVLRTNPDNFRARHVYEKCGFKEYCRDFEHIYMELLPL